MKGVGKFRYDRDGNFVDAENLDKANLNSSDYSRIIRATEKMLNEPDISQPRAREALEALIRARSLGADANPAWTPNARMRPAKSSTQPHKTKTWCALKFKWAPVLAF